MERSVSEIRERQTFNSRGSKHRTTYGASLLISQLATRKRTKVKTKTRSKCLISVMYNYKR
jgi:hypothetical protein